MSGRSELLITDAEWEVMQSVWEADDQTPAEIIARVQPLRKRSHRTIRTLLARLVDKGAVTVRADGSQHLYSAAVSRDDCVRAAAESFSARFFAGDLKSLLMHFVERESLTEQELNELRARLDQITPSTKRGKRRKKG